MAQDQIVAGGNPAWLNEPSGDEAGEDSADLALEEVRYGPATVASIVLRFDGGHVAGTELTLPDLLALRRQLDVIARQAILDGYGIPDESPEEPKGTAESFDYFEVSRVGEIESPDHGGLIIERLDGREEFSDHDRVYWTVYGVRDWDTRPDTGGAVALFDTEDPDEARDVAFLLAQGEAVYRIGDRESTLIEQGQVL